MQVINDNRPEYVRGGDDGLMSVWVRFCHVGAVEL